MKRPADAETYMRKAQRALAAAKMLLGADDTEGACNRAYYAMFYAAHVGLLSVPGAAAAEYKTHRGMIAAFGRYVISSANMDPSLGRSIGAVQQLRQIADYLGDAPEFDKAQIAVEHAEAFVAAMRDRFMGSVVASEGKLD